MTRCRPSAHRCAPRGGSVSPPPTRTVCATPPAKPQYRVDACSFRLYTLAPPDFPTRTPGSVPPQVRRMRRMRMVYQSPLARRADSVLRNAFHRQDCMDTYPRCARGTRARMTKVPHAPQGLARERRARTGEGRLDLAWIDTPLRTEMRRWRKAGARETMTSSCSRSASHPAPHPPRICIVSGAGVFRHRLARAFLARGTLYPSALYRLPGAGAVPRTFPASALGIGIGIGIGIGCEKQGRGGEAELASRACALRIAGDGAMRTVRMRGERSSDLEEREEGSGSRGWGVKALSVRRAGSWDAGGSLRAVVYLEELDDREARRTSFALSFFLLLRALGGFRCPSPYTAMGKMIVVDGGCVGERWSDSLCALAAGGRRLYTIYWKCSGVVTFLHPHPHPVPVRCPT
ncbi:hypothetical protein B0H13DRAFT_2270803 [Mycena leptocephala]|nr:hypothetical protein B0H13DRAFT_2270803 [Mycena leptocephala]